MVMSLSQRFNTMQFFTLGDLANASSTFAFKGNDLAATIAAIGGDNQLRFRIVVAIGNRIRREAAEDDGVDRTDSGTASIAIAASGTIGI